MDTTRRIIQKNDGLLKGEPLVTARAEESVLVQLENLRTLPSAAFRLKRGEQHRHGRVSKIETGEIFGYDFGSGQFVPAAEYNSPASEASIGRRTSATI